MGVPSFLIFDPKHRVWVLVRTASKNVLSQTIKSIKTFKRNFPFLQEKKSLYITWASFRIVYLQNVGYCSDKSDISRQNHIIHFCDDNIFLAETILKVK